ncbi:MAG TPA: MBL fold metallo-hydrolase, partial [Acidobacteriaceae bacterium]
ARLKQLTGAPILYNPRDLPLVKMMDMQAGWLGIATPEVHPPDDPLEEGLIIVIGAAAPAGPERRFERELEPKSQAPEATSPAPASRVFPPETTLPGTTTSPIIGTILHTPGHTQGSICLHLPAQNLLLAGDTLFAGSVGRTDLPGGDTRTLIHSIREKLLPLPDATIVVPGHGPNTTIGQERESNPFLS